MLYMILFWIVLVVLIILFFINMNVKNKRLDSIVGFLVVIQLMLFGLAIATKDPFLSSFGVPTDWELLIEGVASGFAVWKYYLSPMKDRIVKLEINSGKLETKIDGVGENIKLILDKCNVSFKK